MRTKLDMEKAREIRRRYDTEDITQTELGDEYNVDQQAIHKVVTYKTYVEDAMLDKLTCSCGEGRIIGKYKGKAYCPECIMDADDGIIKGVENQKEWADFHGLRINKFAEGIDELGGHIPVDIEHQYVFDYKAMSSDAPMVWVAQAIDRKIMDIVDLVTDSDLYVVVHSQQSWLEERGKVIQVEAWRSEFAYRLVIVDS